ADFASHQTGQHHGDSDSQGSEEAQSNHRGTEERQRHSGNERRERWVYHVSATEEASVAVGRQLAAMESVFAGARLVQRNYGESRQNEDAGIAGDDPSVSSGQPHKHRNQLYAGQKDGSTQP